MQIRVESIDDPRLSDYREIKDKFLLDRGIFLAEGELVVRRLLSAIGADPTSAASPASEWSRRLAVDSVLLADRRADEMLPLIPPGVPIYVLRAEQVSALLGFKFHSGVMAVGRVPRRLSLDDILPPTGPVRVVVTPEIASAENMGTLIRLAAGMGADFLLVGERCTSPWLRRTVRVSMGAGFTLPLVESADVLADLARLRFAGVEVLGSVLDPAGLLGAEVLGSRPTTDRLAVLFGSEGPGLSPTEIAGCTRLVTIPMSHAIDSLNVGIAAGIIMWELFGKRR